MPKRLTLNEFIQKAQIVHGDTYDYSNVEYVNNSTPVVISCSKHGLFYQKPNAHLDLGTGCPRCGRTKSDKSRLLTQDEFISRARLSHNDRYDYAKTIYKHNKQSIIITCKDHGDFEQNAYDHIKKNRAAGCPRCGHLGISNMAIRWLNEMMSKDQIHIQHALNGGEFKVPGTRFKVDGYCKETNTIYEFHGNKWHGSPIVFKPTDLCHPFSLKLAGELFADTITREERLRKLGYNVISIWEHDYLEKINTQKVIK